MSTITPTAHVADFARMKRIARFVGVRLLLALVTLWLLSMIVFAGGQTNICVEATLRHAHALGFYCVVAEDCVASHTPPAHEMTLSTVRFVLGDVAPLAKIAELWPSAA